MMKKISLLLLTVLVAIGASAQLRLPGGVSDAKLWLRSDTLLTTSGTTVTGWGDITGNNTMTLSGTAPTLQANAFGTISAPRLAGATSFYTDKVYNWKTIYVVASSRGRNSVGTPVRTSCLLGWYEPSAPTAIYRLLFYTNASANVNFTFGMYGANPYFRMMALQSPKYYSRPLMNTHNYVPAVHGVFMNDDATDMYATVNGTEVYWTQDHPGGTCLGSIYGQLIVGSGSPAGAANAAATAGPFYGDIAEVIAFDRVLNAEECRKVETYISARYGFTQNGNIPFKSSSAEFEQANTIGRDYTLSDGTVIWPGQSNPALNDYRAYFNFLINDNAGGLHKNLSKPIWMADQWRSNGSTAVSYKDNNVSVANDAPFLFPGAFTTDKVYFVMGAKTAFPIDSMTNFANNTSLVKKQAVLDSVVYGTPYTVSKLDIGGKSYKVWDREYYVKCSGISHISLQAASLVSTWKAWPNQFGTTPGVLTVKNGVATFTAGTNASGVLTVNNIPVETDSKLYIVFASTSETTQIVEGNQTLCTSSGAFTFTATPSGGTWSANAPAGVFTPSAAGKYFVTYSSAGVVDSVIVDVVGSTPTGTVTKDRANIYNGQTVNIGLSGITNAGSGATYQVAVDAGDYSTAVSTAKFSIQGSSLSEGEHSINVKITAANACSTPAVLSTIINKTSGTSPIMPAGVEGAALWVRADHIDSLDTNGRALTLQNMAGTAINITANTSGTYTPAEIKTNWANGQPALYFNKNSFYSTDASRNWLTMFIVHDYLGGTGQSAVSTLHPTKGVTGQDCYYYNMSGSITYGFNNGYMANEQKINLFGCTWQATNYDKTDGLMKSRGALLPLLGSMVSRSDRMLLSVNGTPGYDNFPVLVKDLDLNGYLNLGAAVKAGSTLAAPVYSKLIYGNIAEFIGFDKVLSAAEVNKVESYLAMRYGFNIRGYNADGGGSSATNYRDYILSDGTTVFPAFTDQTLRPYYSYINFLVRDDVSALHIKRSTPISHGVQGGMTDVRPTGGNNSQPLSPQTQEASVVFPASIVKVAVGADFNNPSEISADKAFFAMGRNTLSSEGMGSITTPERNYSKVWLKDYLVRCSGIDKVSFQVDVPADAAAQVGVGAGVLVDVAGVKTFTPGLFENNQITINNVSVSNNAIVYFVVDSHTNSTELSLGDTELCEGSSPVTFVPTTPGGTWSVNAPNGVFSPVNAGVGTHSVSYTVGATTTTSLVKVSPKLVPYFALNLQSNVMLPTDGNMVSVVARENDGAAPAFSFAIDSKTYVPVGSDKQNIDASALSFGTHTMFAKMVSSSTCTLNSGTYEDSIQFEVVNPSNLPKPAGLSDAVLWLRADKGVTVNEDGTLAGWRDYAMKQSTSVFDPYKSTASTLNPSFIAGYPAVTMNGSTLLRVRDDVNYRTMFIVNNYNSVTNKLVGFHNASTSTLAADATLFDYSSSPNLNYKFGLTGGTANTMPYFRYGNAYASTEANIAPGITLPMINGLYMKEDVSDLYVTMNGTVAHFTQDHPTGHAWQAFNGRLILGGYYASSNNYAQSNFRGNIAEVIAFNRELTASETNIIESYLSMKYGYTFHGNTPFQAQGTSGVNSVDFTNQPNKATRNYVLSNGNTIWPGLDDASLADYVAYFNFLVRDDVSGLNKSFSRPQQAVDQLLGSYYRTVIYLDNNVSITNGDSYSHPAALQNDGNYLVMGATAWYDVAPTDGSKILSTGTKPTPGYLQDPTTKKILRVWSRKHHIRSNGVSTVSIKFDTLKTLTPYVQAADKLGLLLEKDGVRTFIPGTADVLGAVLFEGVNVQNAMDVYLMLGEEDFTINNTNLAKATVRDRYHETLTATCSGASSYSFTIVTGTLPEGVSLNTDGTFDGSPTVAGDYPLTIRATDDRGFTTEKELTLNVAADVNCAPIAQPRTILNAGSVGESTKVSLNVPELGTYKVSGLTSGSLPKGLALNAQGEVVGTPSEQGTSRVMIRVKDFSGCEGDVVFDVNVDLPKALSASVVSLYPNPASAYVNLQIAANIETSIHVQVLNSANVKVKDLVLAAQTRQTRLSLTGITPGQYFIVLTAGGKKVAVPILVK